MRLGQNLLQQGAAGGLGPELDLTLYAGTPAETVNLTGGYDVEVSKDGTRFWNLTSLLSGGTTNPAIRQWDLSTPYDLSSRTLTGTFTPSWSTSYPAISMSFGATGDYLFVYSYAPERFVYRIPLATPYDISTAGITDQNEDLDSGSGTAGGMTMAADGKTIFTTNRTTTVFINQLSTADDLSTVGSQTSVDLSAYIPSGGLYDMQFISSGGKHYCIFGTRSANIVYALELGSPEDLTDVIASQSRNFGADSFGVAISSDLAHLYCGTGSQTGNTSRFTFA